MIKAVTCKCIIFSIFSLSPAMIAGELKPVKLRMLNTSIPKVKKSRLHKKEIIDKLNEFVDGDLDFNIFDKKKDGFSVYAKVATISKLGMRYRF